MGDKHRSFPSFSVVHQVFDHILLLDCKRLLRLCEVVYYQQILFRVTFNQCKMVNIHISLLSRHLFVNFFLFCVIVRQQQYLLTLMPERTLIECLVR